MLAFCIVVALFLLAVLGMAIYTSFIKFWPYDKSMSLRHYSFGLVDAGVIVSFFNSLKMAVASAVFGTMFIFGVAYLLEKTRGAPLDQGGGAAAGRECRWPCRAWCWAWATSCSSTIPRIRSTRCTGR